MDADTTGRLIYLGILLFAVRAWVLIEYRGRIGAAVRAATAWGLLFLGLVAGYGLWRDIHQELLPAQAVLQDGSLEIPRAADGHFYATLEIGGTPVRFMADTGASSIVLAADDARRLGIDPGTLAYIGEAATANGPVRTARVRLEEVALGPFLDRSVGAWVNEGEMPASLLGMDYLSRFRIAIERDRMILSR